MERDWTREKCNWKEEKILSHVWSRSLRTFLIMFFFPPNYKIVRDLGIHHKKRKLKKKDPTYKLTYKDLAETGCLQGPLYVPNNRDNRFLCSGEFVHIVNSKEEADRLTPL